jgi:hypothetical protein
MTGKKYCDERNFFLFSRVYSCHKVIFNKIKRIKIKSYSQQVFRCFCVMTLSTKDSILINAFRRWYFEEINKVMTFIFFNNAATRLDCRGKQNCISFLFILLYSKFD